MAISVAAAAVLLVSAPAWAAPSAEAQWDELSKTDGFAPQVLDEIRNKIPSPVSPSHWSVIFIHKGYPEPRDMERQDWTREKGLLLERDPFFSVTYDPLGLVQLRQIGTSGTTFSVLADLSISAPISAQSAAMDVNIRQRVLTYDSGTVRSDTFAVALVGAMPVLEVHWSGSNSIASLGPQIIQGSKNNTRDYLRDQQGVSGFSYDPRFGAFWPREDLLVDWRVENQPWHSLTVSAALSGPQHEQARSLFARGFDLFKAGDFTGARAMVDAAQKIDPGNHLGWFTLGEIGRSMAVKDKYSGGGIIEAVAYQHTIDLAPDSPEAALAKGYLAGLH